MSSYSSSDSYQAEALEDIGEIYSEPNNPAALIKLTLPIYLAGDLLTLCAKLGTEGSTLFPGYHGVAKSVRDWAGYKMSQEVVNEVAAKIMQNDKVNLKVAAAKK